MYNIFTDYFIREDSGMAKLVECIPNFSVSREQDEAVFQGLVDVANSIPGCTLFDVQSDGSHNRCVFTLIGSPAAIEEAAFRLAEQAAATIDMTKHVGQHPRMGATDVIPFVPQIDVTVEECVAMSKRVAQRIWEELKIPSFLYEDSATRPERKIHPTAGITAIGARMPLIAFNVNLGTSDLEIAKKIAKAVRGSSGGFQYCKAIGIKLEERNIAQVSMNMVNYEGTPLYYALEMIRMLAGRYGVPVIGTELVGLTPAKALIDCAEHYLQIENFDCKKQVMEYHLIDMNR